MSGEVVAVIPARYGSTLFPGKPLADINGLPMVVQVWRRAMRAKLVDDVIVATDDERIANAVRLAGGKADLTPSSLQTGSDRVAHVARGIASARIIVNLQGDEPLINPEMIDQAVQPLISDPSLVVGTLVRRIADADELTSTGIVKVAMDRNGFALYFSRSVIPFGRDASPDDFLSLHAVYKHIGLYVFRKDFLFAFTAMKQTPLELAENLEQLRILENGYRIHVTITEHDSIPVDTPADLEHVRRLAALEP